MTITIDYTPDELRPVPNGNHEANMAKRKKRNATLMRIVQAHGKITASDATKLLYPDTAADADSKAFKRDHDRTRVDLLRLSKDEYLNYNSRGADQRPLTRTIPGTLYTLGDRPFQA